MRLDPPTAPPRGVAHVSSAYADRASDQANASVCTSEPCAQAQGSGIWEALRRSAPVKRSGPRSSTNGTSSGAAVVSGEKVSVALSMSTRSS